MSRVGFSFPSGFLLPKQKKMGQFNQSNSKYSGEPPFAPTNNQNSLLKTIQTPKPSQKQTRRSILNKNR